MGDALGADLLVACSMAVEEKPIGDIVIVLGPIDSRFTNHRDGAHDGDIRETDFDGRGFVRREEVNCGADVDDIRPHLVDDPGDLDGVGRQG